MNSPKADPAAGMTDPGPLRPGPYMVLPNLRMLYAQRRLAYLACPYTDQDPVVQRRRVTAATIIAASLAQIGLCIYSPLTHGTGLAEFLPEGVKKNHTFWMQQCLPWLAGSDRFILLPLSGWEKSRGVQEEIDFAISANMKLYVVQSNHLTSQLTMKVEKFPAKTLKEVNWNII